ASVIAVEGAGLRFRDMQDLREGQALAWDVTGASLAGRDAGAPPPVAPREAGANLARLAAGHDLVFFESFLPDLAGHGRLTTDYRPTTAEDRGLKIEDSNAGAKESLSSILYPLSSDTSSVVRRQEVGEQIDVAMRLLDGMLGGLLAALRPQDSLLISS